MYCSIEDAWGKDFNQDSKDVDSDKPKEFKQNEYKVRETFDTSDSESSINFKQRKKLHKQYLKLHEMFGDEEKENKVCLAVNTHINTCSICRNRYLKRIEDETNSFSLPSISSIINKLNKNSDAVTIFLICIMILLIIKLFNKN